MISTVFIIIRYGVLVICDLVAMASIIYIIRKKLYKSLPILFILFAEISNIITLSITIVFMVYNSINQIDQNKILDFRYKPICYMEGYFFTVSQFITLNFTGLLIYSIYKGIKQEAVNFYENKLYYIGFSLIIPFILMLAQLITKTYYPCTLIHGIVYNCVCFEINNNDSVDWSIFFLWNLSYFSICLFMLFFLYKIKKEKNKKEFFMSDEKSISLCLTKYPILDVTFIIINVIVHAITSIDHSFKNNTVIVICLYLMNLLVFLLPIPNFYAVLRAHKKMEEILGQMNKVSIISTSNYTVIKS